MKKVPIDEKSHFCHAGEPTEITCPFCQETDFDLQGLHDHISLYCDEFHKIETDHTTLASLMHDKAKKGKK